MLRFRKSLQDTYKYAIKNVISLFGIYPFKFKNKINSFIL